MASARSVRNWMGGIGLLMVSVLIHAGLVLGLWRVDGVPPPPPARMAVSWVQVLAPVTAPLAPLAQPEVPAPPAPVAKPEPLAPPKAPRPSRAPSEPPSASAMAAVHGTVDGRASGPAVSDEAVAAVSADDFGGLTERAAATEAAPEAAPRAVPEAVAQAATGTGERMPDPPVPTPIQRDPRSPDPQVADQGAQTSSATNAPGSFSGRWRYQIFLGDYREGPAVGWLDYVLEIEGGRYRLFTQAQATGLTGLLMRGVFRQSSSGQVSAEGFSPEQYEERRGDRAPRGFTVDPSLNQVSFLGGQSAPRVEGLQDRLSIFTQLSWMASQGRIKPQDITVKVPVVGTSKVREMRFRIQGDQSLEGAGGAIVNTVNLSTIAEPGDEEGSIDIWFQQGGPLLPVRIRFVDQRGRVMDQFLTMP